MASSNQIIPLDSSPNQSWKVALNINGSVVVLQITLRYNEIAEYWVMTVRDSGGNLLLDSIPFITATGPGENILAQFTYLEIGSALILNVSGVIQDIPDSTDLGTDFELIWGTTPTGIEVSIPGFGAQPAPAPSFLLLESGDLFNLENGTGALLLES